MKNSKPPSKPNTTVAAFPKPSIAPHPVRRNPPEGEELERMGQEMAEAMAKGLREAKHPLGTAD